MEETTWYPGANTDIGIVVFLAVVIIFIIGLYNFAEKLFRESLGGKMAEYVIMTISLLGILKACKIV